MPDDLSTELQTAVELEEVHLGPDVSWVVARGRRLRLRRMALAVLTTISLVALSSIAVVTLFRSSSDLGPAEPDPRLVDADPDVQEPRPNEIVEDISEKQRAEIFAFRAVAASGLMQLDRRAYLFTYDDDTTQEGDLWKVGFAASQCGSSNCRAIGGRNPDGRMPAADTFPVVRLSDGVWQVVGVEGNILPEERDRLLGYSLVDKREPSHWEIIAPTIVKFGDELSMQTSPLWVGPYPTQALGSVCRVTPDPGGDTVFFMEAPSRVLERGGWVMGREFPELSQDSELSVDCRQYTGRVWEVSGDPKLVRVDSDVVGFSANLIWRGEEGFTTGARCRGTLVDGNGDVVFEGSGRVEPLWRPGELKNHPYETTVMITRGDPIDAEEVGDFSCESR